MFDATANREIRAIQQFDLNIKDELIKEVLMSKQEKPGITSGEQAKIDQTSQCSLAEVMSVSLLVFGQTNLAQDNIQARMERDRLKHVRPIRI
jgi:hypothetical protein